MLHDTGSGNISKATIEWAQIYHQAKQDAAPDQHPLHRAYELINEQVANGQPWAKCANCGSPYKLTEHWGNDTVCSESCASAYISYLNSM